MSAGDNKPLVGPPTPVRIDPTQARQAQEFKHTSPLVSCRFDPSGRFVFAGAQDNTVQRWELATGKRAEFAGHKSWVRALAFHSEQKLLYSGDYQGRILVWRADADGPDAPRPIDAHRGWVRALAVSPDGRLLASCGNDNLVKLWTAGGEPVRELSGYDCHVYNVAFHPGGDAFVSADLKGVVKHWDVTKGTALRDLDAKALYKYDPTFRADIGGARGMAFRADGKRLACAGITEVTNAFAGIGKPLVIVFDWETGKPLELKPKEAFQGAAWGVAFHPAGFVVAVGGGNGGALWFWKSEEALAFHTLKLPNNARDMALSPDGRSVAVAFFDNALRVYDLTAR